MATRKIAVFGLVGVVSFASGGWLLQRGGEAGADAYHRSGTLDEVVAYVSRYYVDSIAPSDLYDMAIDGMLSELGDPYTDYLRESDFRDLRQATTGNYGGLGIRIDVRDGWITVVTPLSDTPAERAGIESGDQIVEVEGESTRGWTAERALSALKGPAGSPVDIRIRRPGYPDLMPFTITREMIHVSSVGVHTVLRGDVGYLSLDQVSDVSAREVRETLQQLEAQGARRFILDLRINQGGVLQQAVGVTDLFLPPGLVSVETRGRAPGSTLIYNTEQPAVWPDAPVVVLVGRFTASAAEIIAGALQDHDRALVIGEPTYGKGVAQLVFQFGENEALRVTTSRWYTPLGRSIQRSLNSLEDSTRVIRTIFDLIDSTEVYETPRGRRIYGGGGIIPDVVVETPPLDSAEQRFAAALGSSVGTFRDALTAYALEVRGRDHGLTEDFSVTPAMLRELRQFLADRGVTVTDAEWRGAEQLVSDQLGYELARYLFDRGAEMRRRALDDVVIRRAVLALDSGLADLN